MAILPVALCPLLLESSVIDGQLDEDIWILPPSIPFFVRPRVRWIPEAQTQVYASYDADGFNIAFRCFEDAPERIERNAGPPAADSLFVDDHVGFRFMPEDTMEPGMRPFHFICTGSGKLFREIDPGIFTPQEQFPCAAQAGEADWCAEVRLPFNELGLKAPRAGQRWGFAAYRQRVGARCERSGWVEVGLGPFGETLPGWLLFENPGETDRKRGRAVEPYLRRFGQILETRIHQVAEAEGLLPQPDACPLTRHRIHLMIHSLMSIKNDMLHSFHPDALRHYAQILQFNVGRLDELIENLRQGEDPHTAPDGYVFLGTHLEADNAQHAFALIQGRGYESTMPHPLIVLLHGFSEDWIADSRQYLDLAWPSELDFLLAMPSGVGTNRTFRLAAEDEVFAVIQEVRRRFSVDPQRTILVGLGPGTEAAYRFAARFPDVFSTVAVGGPVATEERLHAAPSVPFHYWAGPEIGWVGPLHPVDQRTRENLATLPPAGPQALTPKFIQRLTAPLETSSRVDVDLRASTPRYGRAKWARIDRPQDYSRPAHLNLKVLDDGRVQVSSDNVGSFTICPNQGPFVPGQTVRIECEDRELISGSYSQSLQCDISAPPKGSLVKTAELCGPIDEAFHGALLYVYGTAGTPEQAAMLREAALQACRWPRFDLRIPVKADAEVTEEDLGRAHIHLFGPPQLNHLTAQIAARLPVKMEMEQFVIGGKTFAQPGHLCQFIYPNPLMPRRYVLVHAANSRPGWLYRGWFPKKEQPEPLPDLWVARLEDNERIGIDGVAPNYQWRAWFDAQWRLKGESEG